jgi:hypothetical protein
MKGLPVKPKQIAPPAAVHDLMAALKRSLAQEGGAGEAKTQSCRRSPPDQPAAASLGKDKGASYACNRDSPAKAAPKSMILN